MKSNFPRPVLVWSIIIIPCVAILIGQQNPMYEIVNFVVGLAFIMGIVGLINPQWVLLTNRKKSSLIFFGLMFLMVPISKVFETPEIRMAREQEKIARAEAREAKRLEKESLSGNAVSAPSAPKLSRSEVSSICKAEILNTDSNSLPDDMDAIRKKARDSVNECAARYGY